MGSDQLTEDLEAMHKYYTKWCLKPNPVKSELAGTTWGADGDTLRNAARALTYSVEEYCAPSGTRATTQIKSMYIQLNESMRIISGTLKSTPTMWLPILTNLAPVQLRRSAAVHKEWTKVSKNPPDSLPIQKTLNHIRPNRLKSRQPIWMDDEIKDDFCMAHKWNELVSSRPDVKNIDIIHEPTLPVLGSDLPRQTWSRINRFRTGHGRCRDMMHKWGIVDSPECDCVAPRQAMDHILNECPTRLFPGGLQELHTASQTAINWINDLDINV
ncbi:hypothetical protein JTB14_028461 [Gonioctena quinquepunctata]|nr:hypothetical protein JTB14_028461 [Gonioctena quinquepunctata]